MSLEGMIEQIEIWSTDDRAFEEAKQIIAALRRLERLERAGQKMRNSLKIVNKNQADCDSEKARKALEAWDAAVGEKE